MTKIVHLHSDYKFVSETKRYQEYKELDNTVIFVGERSTLGFVSVKNVIHFEKYTDKNISKIVQIVDGSDILIVYNLLVENTSVVLGVSEKVKVLWRFFGFELYSRMPHLQYTSKTLRLIRYNKKKYNINNNIIRLFVRSIKKRYKKYRNDKLFVSAVNRCDYMFCINKIEYDYLKKYWPFIPEYLEMPKSKKKIRHNISSKKEGLIIIGQSRNAGNNHVEIFDIFIDGGWLDKYSIIIPFSYGEENAYTSYIRELVKKKDNIKLMEDYIGKEIYEEMYVRASCFVLNTLRQKGMGNLWMALRNGVKVYLNKQNIYYKILRDRGYIISGIDELKNDLVTGNIGLKAGDIEQNREVYYGQQRGKDLLVIIKQALK